MSPESYGVVVVIAIGIRVAFYMMRSRDRHEARERMRELDQGASGGERDGALDDLIRDNEQAPKAARKRDRKRGFGPVVDEVKRRCERCDMRVSDDRKLCSPCERAVKRAKG